MSAEPQFTKQVVYLEDPEVVKEFDRIKNLRGVTNRSALVREIIRAGLPIVAKRYQAA